MKRSKSLKLALMSASVLTVTACDNPQEVAIFETLEQCINDTGTDQKYCETNFQIAEREHIRAAPKYTAIADCEADFGAEKCETAPQTTQSGGSVFMPLMMGYMMGSMLSNSSRVGSQPLYRSKDNPANFRTADNHKVSGKTGISKVPSNVAKAPATKMRTTRRGGFGATARASSGRARSFGG